MEIILYTPLDYYFIWVYLLFDQFLHDATVTLIANVILKKTIFFSPLLSILLLLYSQAMYIGQTHVLNPMRKVFCMSRMLWKRINGWLPKVMHKPIVVLNYAPTIVPITVLATVTVPSDNPTNMDPRVRRVQRVCPY